MSFVSVIVFTTVLAGLGSVNCCKPGWLQFQTKCYWFSHYHRPWGEAESICAGFHAKLAEPLNHGQSAFLTSQFQILGGHFYWIGISDLVSEDIWIYSSTQDHIRINDFSPGEPNQYTSANCVALWDRYHGKWADEPCEHSFTFICESDAEEVVGAIG